MAAASDNDGMFRPAGSAPLGAILVRRGVLTEEQLATALAEQEKSGEQLGEIIVRLGFAAGPMIAQALATQYGRLLKTEYGYAVGFDDAALGPFGPAPVGSLPAQDQQATAPTPAAGLRVALPAQSVPATAPAPAEVQATRAAAATPTLDDVVPKWRQQTRQLEAQRDAALRDLRAVAVERAASAAELEAVTARCAELEAAADQAEAEREMVSSARDGAVQRNAELERRLAELQAASARTTELAAAATAAEQEKAAREQARDEAASRIAELEERVVELEAAAAADDGHLAAATARVAELESSAARDCELEAELTAAREESARIQREKGALEAAHVSMAAHNADLEERLKQLEAANTRTAQHERQLEETAPQIVRLEAERDNVSAVAHVPGQERRGHHPDQHAEDPSHLLFVPGSEGYRLVEQDGPLPSPGSMLELPEDDGTISRLFVLKVGPAPLPSVRLACAYLVAAE